MQYSMQYLNKYTKVRKFCIKNNLYILVDNQIIIDTNGAIRHFNFPSSTFYCLENGIFSGRNFYINQDELISLKELEGYYFSGISYNNLLVFSGNDFMIYDLNEKKSIFRSSHYEDRSLYKLFKEIFICYGGTFLSCHKILDGHEQWRINFKELMNGEEVKIYGKGGNELIVLGDKLFVFVQNRNMNHQATICININSGQVLHKTTTFGGIIYTDGQKLYVASNRKIAILDPATFGEERIDLEEELGPHDFYIEYDKSLVKDGLLYFAARPGKLNIASIVGILDISARKLLWHTELLKDPNKKIDNENRLQVQEIQASEELLCVLVAGGTLFVFKKAEN
jgi:hypothetical protein